MNFLGHGYESLEHTDRTDNQKNATENISKLHWRMVTIFTLLLLVYDGMANTHLSRLTSLTGAIQCHNRDALTTMHERAKFS